MLGRQRPAIVILELSILLLYFLETYPFSQLFTYSNTINHQKYRTGLVPLSSEKGSNWRKVKSEPSSAGKLIRQTNDPWKVLLKKLDATKSSQDKFGKVLRPTKNNSEIDVLQCPHFESCAGCTIKGNFSEAPTVLRAKNFFISENVRFRTHIGNHHGWRTHAKLAVQPLSRWGGLKFGLYKLGSHEVEPIPDCKVHHPRINEAVDILRREATDVGVKGYQRGMNGLPPQGELRYIQMSMERSTQKIQLVLVWNAEEFKGAEQTLPRLVKRLKSQPDLWHSVYVNFQTSESNAIFNYAPKSWKLLWGPPALKETIGKANFFFTPQVFRQV